MDHGAALKTTTDGWTTVRRLDEWLPAENLRGVVSSVPASYPSGTIWPHGEWSLGYAKERPDGGGNDGAAWYVPDGVVGREMTPGWAGGLPLNLSDATNSHSRSKRGLKGMSGYGQQMIKACGHLMGQKWPHHRKTLGTVTLPPMSREARAQIVSMWGELTRQLLQWLSRRLERQGLPPVVCSVTEIQPKRLQALGEGCLHWHLLWLNVPAKSGNWAVDPCDVRAWLADLIKRKCDLFEGGHINVNTKAVEGTVAAYLAKYMSKGRQMIAEAIADWGEDNCPATWWNMTGPARAMVKAAVRKGREAGAVLEECLDHSRRVGVDEVYAFLSPCEIEVDNSRIIIGWRGRFHESVFGLLTGVLESLDIE